MTDKIFKNETQAYTPESFDSVGTYKFKNVSPYLLTWSRFFQALISQAGTYILTGKFHDQDCGIYKSEGGCNIPDEGELVLCNDMCYFDRGFGKFDKVKYENKTNLMSDLISYVIIYWDPSKPTESMIKTAVEHINSLVVDKVKITEKEFKKVMEKAKVGGVFGGNPLSSFFDRNPFENKNVNRDYERFCLVNFGDKTEAEVDQIHADEDLGKDLLKKMKDKYRECIPESYSSPMCCSPHRGKDGLKFWINTGSFTQIDGWKSQKDIESYLASDGKLIDTHKV